MRRAAGTPLSGSGRREGFTLLEVMGAVVVLGMVYVVLASAAIQGLRAEGDAERRLRAASLADLEVARIEEDLALGVPPSLGSTTREEDGFEVVVSTGPFEVPAELWQDPALAPAEPGAPTLLPDARSREPSPLRVVEVRVRWDDGSGPQEVVRASFGVDSVAVQEVLQSAGLGEGGDGAGLLPGSPGAPR